MRHFNNITIVGGGSAAWLAAAFISHNFWDVPLTVIDKEVGNPIGVGEATVLTFPGFLRRCGVNLPEWFKNVDATYKAGIQFPDWKKQGSKIYHPFFLNKSYFLEECTQYDVWANKFQDKSFRCASMPTYDTTMSNKVDVWDSFESLAYHIDAGLLVKELKSRTQCNFINSEVTKINRKENGDIESLELKNGKIHHGDFFIDCTGFESILKKQQRVELYGEGRLFTNAAVATRVEYQDVEKERVPYVKCPAVEHGWIWKIPTQSRIGTGLVFNTDITDVDTAKQFFSEYWNGRAKPEDMKFIKWVPYYSKNFWEGNVLSIGLSGGFIEPLESTGLASMTAGVEKLALTIPTHSYSDADIEMYNKEMIMWYEDAVDYVNSHYADNEHDSKFWQFVRDTHVKSEKHLFYEKWLADPDRPFYTRTDTKTLFHPPNWQLWLIQMGYPVAKNLNNVPPYVVEKMMNDFKSAENIRKRTSISHSDAIYTTNEGVDWWQKSVERSK